jgi:hypothetical protein
MLPSAALQVTDLSVTVPWTLAVNCKLPPVLAEVETGDTEMEVTVGVGAGVAVTETVAVANMLESALLVATTVSVPAFAGAVYTPEVEMLPRAARQLTDLSVTVPWTEALNCKALPVFAELEVGETEMEVTTGVGVGDGFAAATVTVAEEDLVLSATLVAVTTSVPALAGAV